MSCTTTRITSSWREPDKTVSVEQLNKVLVVAMLKDETSRHKAEDQMKMYLQGKGIVSYNYLEQSINEKDEKQIIEKIKADNFDGAVIMRLIDVDRDVNYVPGRMSSYPFYYRSFGGYYRRSWIYYSTPNRYFTTKTYTIEVNIYSIKEDRIIWAGLTETTNPEGVDKMTNDIAKVVYQKMIQEGFIRK
jgi:hypothetical protein